MQWFARLGRQSTPESHPWILGMLMSAASPTESTNGETSDCACAVTGRLNYVAFSPPWMLCGIQRSSSVLAERYILINRDAEQSNNAIATPVIR